MVILFTAQYFCDKNYEVKCISLYANKFIRYWIWAPSCHHWVCCNAQTAPDVSVSLSLHPTPPVIPHRRGQLMTSCPRGVSPLSAKLKCLAAQPLGSVVTPLHNYLCLRAFYHSRSSCLSVQTLSIMEATVKIKSNDKSPENWQFLSEMLKNVGCKYSTLQIIRKWFLAFRSTNEDVSRITPNEVNIDLSKNGVIVVDHSI